MSVAVMQGDCRSVLATLPAASIQCCVTSPPYYGMRDYGVSDQLGLEPTPEAFIAEMVAVFREVRRVLTGDGTLWLNIGDSYNNRTRIRSSSHKPVQGRTETRTWAEASAAGGVRMTITKDGWKEKDLFGIPWMLAQALRADGWYLRQEIIWSKPVAKLDVATDRPLTRHETIFLLSKSKRYYFDGKSLPAHARGSVWTLPASGRADHGASYTPALIEPCILAGCPAGGVVLDPFFGSGTTGVAADKLGRSCIGIELNPIYVRAARERVSSPLEFYSEIAA